jgi:hypothetical protein
MGLIGSTQVLTMEEHEKLQRAKERVEAITGFYIHLSVYILVNAVLLIINVLSGEPWWVQWPILGWGIGVVAHGLAVFFRQPRFIATWQLRKIHEIKNRM